MKYYLVQFGTDKIKTLRNLLSKDDIINMASVKPNLYINEGFSTCLFIDHTPIEEHEDFNQDDIDVIFGDCVKHRFNKSEIKREPIIITNTTYKNYGGVHIS